MGKECVALARVKRWDEPLARAELAAWQASGKSMSSFSQARGYHAQRLAWWRDRLAAGIAGPGRDATGAQVPPPGFVEATVSAVTWPPAPALVLRLPCGVDVEVHAPDAVAAPWLGALARSLSAGA
jgi:hypothetical protein